MSSNTQTRSRGPSRLCVALLLFFASPGVGCPDDPLAGATPIESTTRPAPPPAGVPVSPSSKAAADERIANAESIAKARAYLVERFPEGRVFVLRTATAEGDRTLLTARELWRNRAEVTDGDRDVARRMLGLSQFIREAGDEWRVESLLYELAARYVAGDTRKVDDIFLSRGASEAESRALWKEISASDGEAYLAAVRRQLELPERLEAKDPRTQRMEPLEEPAGE